MSGSILIGTSSWTDPTLVKETEWYPKKSMSAADRLAYYAARYPIAEADSTYYFPPRPELTKGWVERTPRGFTMNVKAYGLFTGHPTKVDSLWRDIRDDLPKDIAGRRNVYLHHLDEFAVDEAWKRFVTALRPLDSAGKLGAAAVGLAAGFFAGVRAALAGIAASASAAISNGESRIRRRPP